MYKIRLDQFEGPLDLLLFFIKRDEMDIYDIPIAKITKEFLEYVHLIKVLDLEMAGDFILLASTLMHIKVRMLLPKEVDEKGEEIDPRAELVQRLLEYRRFKEVAEELSYNEMERRKLFLRGNFENDEVEKPPEIESALRNVTVFDLAKAFRRAMDAAVPEQSYEIKKIPVSIDDQMKFINETLETYKEIDFITLCTQVREKIILVVTFVALLEMVKMEQIGLRESENHNDFIIYRM